MNRRKMLAASLLVLPLAVGGVVLATAQTNDKPTQQASEEGYVCPATGEVLPCPNCCPLKSE